MKQRFLSRRVLAAVCVVALLGAAFRATGIVCYWDCNDDDDFLHDKCSCPPGHGVGGRGGRGGHAGGGGSGGFPGLSDGAMPIPGDCADCAHTYGMPGWRVSEPFVNLWVEDEPLRYQPGYGPAVRVRLAYRYHSQEAATLSTNVFNVGMGWNCSLLSFVDSPAGSTTKRVAYPGGGAGYYVPGGASDHRTNWKLEQTVSNSVVVAFTLIKTDGSRWVYAHQVIDPIGSRHRYCLTEMKDPAGEKLSLVYSASYASNGVARLLSITDATGQSTTIHYATNQSYEW